MPSYQVEIHSFWSKSYESFCAGPPIVPIVNFSGRLHQNPQICCLDFGVSSLDDDDGGIIWWNCSQSQSLVGDCSLFICIFAPDKCHHQAKTILKWNAIVEDLTLTLLPLCSKFCSTQIFFGAVATTGNFFYEGFSRQDQPRPLNAGDSFNGRHTFEIWLQPIDIVQATQSHTCHTVYWVKSKHSKQIKNKWLRLRM